MRNASRLLTAIVTCALAAGVALAGSLTPPGPPAPTMKAIDVAEPRIPISSLPFNVNSPGSYYLTKSLTLAGNAVGISVNSGPVTIDLNGFSLTGDGSAGSIGISVGPYDLVLKNGSIARWATGVGAGSGGVHVLENLTFRSCTGDGAQITDGMVRNCGFHFNGYSGLTAWGTTLVTGSRFFANGGYGVYLAGARSLIEDSVMDANLAGVALASGGVIRHCVVTENTLEGIRVDGAAVVADNNIYNNLQQGIWVAGADGKNRIEGNNISWNGGFAVSGYGGNVIVKNTFSNNVGTIQGSPNIAPIDTTGTSTNPWVNFSY